MIEIQEDLALNIAKALETTMDPAALAAMTSVGTRSVEAYQEYLHGLNLLTRSSAENDAHELYLLAYDRFEKARAIDPKFTAAHVQSADFWRVQLTPSRTDTGLTDLQPNQMLTEFNKRIDLAIKTAKTEIDTKGYTAQKALVELRLHEAISLFSEYLKARPNDELIRSTQLDAAMIASDKTTQQDIIAHWHERGLSDLESAIGYANSAHRVIDPSIAADFINQILRRWPNHVSLIYQAHRTMLWAGRIMEARELADRFNRLNPEGAVILTARQACVEGRRAEVEALLLTIDPGNNDDRSERWHLLKLLGRDKEAGDELRVFADSGIPYQIADLLGYNQFDPSPYPSLLTVLEREGIKRPPPVEIPFKCPPPEQTSIAVLPFVNMSNDAENEFFSDGIAEEILNVLASIPDLKVAARTSAFAYKGTNTNISRIADELGVNHILEGSVRKSGNQVRVTAQLIKADDGFHLWSENYDRELTNIFAIQDEIAGSIADALKVSLELQSGSAGNLTGTKSIEAYEHYLKGMSLWHERTAISLTAAIQEFEAAANIDPQFAKAYAGQAITWGVIDGYINMDSTETQAKTSAAAKKALALDPENVESIAIQGLVARNEFRYEDSTELFKRAMELNPSYASAYQWYGLSLAEMGDQEVALAMLQKAWSLDPRSRIIGVNLAWILNFMGRDDEAEKIALALLKFAPEFPDGLNLIFDLKIIDGNCSAAKVYGDQLAALLKKTVNSTPLYLDLCQQDDPALRKAAIEIILAWPELEFSNPAHPSLSYEFDIVDVFVELGELEAAWTMINKSREKKSMLAWVRQRQTPNGIRLQCDQRFIKAVKEAGIPWAVNPVQCG